MKRLLTLLTIAAIGAVLTIPADAAKGDKKGKKGGAEALTAYDKDANGKIDGTEVDAAKADCTAGKQPAKALDTNNDGTLSDDEIAAAGAKGKGGKKKKKK